MRPALSSLLLSRHPEVFAHCRIFEHEDGWFSIVDRLAEVLERVRPAPRATQVKEKFGGLRFYHDAGLPDDFDAAVTCAEHYSQRVCEQTGRPGILHNAGWVRTMAPDAPWVQERQAKPSKGQHCIGTGASYDEVALHALTRWVGYEHDSARVQVLNLADGWSADLPPGYRDIVGAMLETVATAFTQSQLHELQADISKRATLVQIRSDGESIGMDIQGSFDMTQLLPPVFIGAYNFATRMLTVIDPETGACGVDDAGMPLWKAGR